MLKPKSNQDSSGMFLLVAGCWLLVAGCWLLSLLLLLLLVAGCWLLVVVVVGDTIGPKEQPLPRNTGRGVNRRGLRSGGSQRHEVFQCLCWFTRFYLLQTFYISSIEIYCNIYLIRSWYMVIGDLNMVARVWLHKQIWAMNHHIQDKYHTFILVVWWPHFDWIYSRCTCFILFHLCDL